MSQLTKGLITFRGLHRDLLEVGQGGFRIVVHGKNEMATCPGALEDV